MMILFPKLALLSHFLDPFLFMLKLFPFDFVEAQLANGQIFPNLVLLRDKLVLFF